jgi:UDP-glucose 4-epimerase
MPTARVGVTGASGFLGSALCASLHADGDLDARELRRETESLEDVDSLVDFVDEVDVVVHLAGKNRATDEELLAGNVIPTWNLARAAAAHRAPRPIVFASSLHVYPLANTPHTEGSTPTPRSVYGLSKLTAERALADLGDASVSLRFGNIYGSGARPYYNSGVATFFDLARTGKPTTVHGDGAALRDYLYVDDAVEALHRAVGLALRGDGGVYNVTSGDRTSILDLVAAMREATGLAVAVEREGDASTQGLADSLYADAAAFRAATGWAPEHSLVDGLRATYAGLQAADAEGNS